MNAMEWILPFVYLLLTAAMACAVFRVVRGPSLVDRVVGLDLMAMVVAGMSAVYAIDSGKDLFLDVVLVMAIVVFFSTVAFGRYLAKRIT